MHLRAKGVKMKIALQEFKPPITDGEWVTLGVLIIIATIAATLIYKTEIDGALVESLQREAIATERMHDYKVDSEYSDKIIASMLNGRFKLNGKVVTLCFMDAAGGCK